MSMHRAYWALLIVWMLIGIPIIVLGIGFAGDALFTVRGVVAILSPPTENILTFGTWLIAWFIILAPLWGWVLFRQRENRDGK